MVQPQLLDTKTMSVIESTIDSTDETKDTRYYLEEYFKQRPALNAVINQAYSDADATASANTALTTARVVANKDFEVLGTSATTALVTFSATNAALLLTTAGADNDQMIIAPHLDTNQTAWQVIEWGTENSIEWEASIKTGAAITTLLIWAGLKLTNTPTIITDADQLMFRFSTDDSDANWHTVTSIANTDTTTDTGIVVAANTTYNFKIKIDANRIAKLYINDLLVATTTALTNDVDLIPYIGVQALDTATVTLLLNYIKISRSLFE